jgi:hypothetical protein
MSNVDRIIWIQHKVKWNNLYLIRASTKQRGSLLARKSAIVIVLQIRQQLERNSLLSLGLVQTELAIFYVGESLKKNRSTSTLCTTKKHKWRLLKYLSGTPVFIL